MKIQSSIDVIRNTPGIFADYDADHGIVSASPSVGSPNDVSTASWTASNLSSRTATRLVCSVDAAPTTHRVYQLISAIRYVTTPSPLITLSADCKADTKSWVQLNINAGAYFDLANGVVGTLIGTGTTATIVPLGDGWYRCTVTGPSTGTGYYSIYLAVANNVTFQDDGTGAVFVTNIQIYQPLITKWVDQTGHGNDVLQGTAAVRPTFEQSNAFYNKSPVVNFAGAWMRSAAFERALTQPYTIYLVGNIATGGVTSRMIYDGIGAKRTSFYRYSTTVPAILSPTQSAAAEWLTADKGDSLYQNNVWCVTHNGASSYIDTLNQTSPALSPGTEDLAGITIGTGNGYETTVPAILSPTQSAAAEWLTADKADALYQNNVWCVTHNGASSYIDTLNQKSTALPPGTEDLAGITIGTGNGYETYLCDGKIARLIVYSGLHNANQRSAIMQALAAKYASQPYAALVFDLNPDYSITNDFSGQGHTLTWSDTPTIVTGGMNGHNTITCAGAYAVTDVWTRTVVPTFTMIAVCRPANYAAAWHQIMDMNVDGIGWGGSNNRFFASPGRSGGLATAVQTPGLPYIVWFVSNGTSSQIGVNSLTASVTSTNTSNTLSGPLNIARDSRGLSQYFRGDIARIQIFNGIVNLTEVVTKLASTYNITLT